MAFPLLLPVLFLALGGFTLAAQTLLFREYLVGFQGNELGVALFFFAWLFWIAVGALSGALLGRRLAVERAFLVVAAAFPLVVFLQVILLISIRAIAGVEPFELFPLDRLLVATLLANAPAALVFGFLFQSGAVFAGAWSGAGGTGPGQIAARLYAVESLGSFLGGLAVTGLLWWRLETIAILAGAAALLAVCILALAFAARRVVAAAGALVLLALAAAVLLTPLDGDLERRLAELRWRGTLPDGELLETRETPYQRVSVAALERQTVFLANGSVVASTADTPARTAAAALLLAEAPGTRRVLVIGLAPEGLVPRLLCYPVVHLDLVLFDEAASAVVWPYLDEPVREALRDPRVATHFGDPRDFVNRSVVVSSDERYDLVVLDLPDPETAHLNRFYTVDFFRAVRAVLAERGVLALTIRAGENYASSEILNYGRSVYRSLREVFAAVVVTPGERAWLFAAPERGVVSVDPAELEERYRALPARDPTVPPEVFASLIPVERVAGTLALFEGTDGAPVATLVNTDRRPVTLFLNLQVLAAESGGRFARVLQALGVIGPTVFLIPLALFLLLRLLYRATTPVVGGAAAFNGCALLAFAGGTAMCLDIVLLVSFQNRFGNLFLAVGLLAALFMLGLFLGGAIGVRACRGITGIRFWPAHVVLAPAVVLCLLLPALLDWLAAAPPGVARAVYLAAFLLAGAVCGLAFPAAGHFLERTTQDGGLVAGLLESADHWGGAVGAALVGVLALPVLGLYWTCLLLALALGTVWLLFLAEQAGGGLAGTRLGAWCEWARRRNERVRGRAPAFVLAGVVLAAVWISGLLAAELNAPRVRLDVDWIRSRTNALRVEERDEPFVHYVALDSTGARTGEAFAASAAIAPDVAGYNGPINLLIETGEDGNLRDVRLLESSETPAYIHGAENWLEQFRGWPLDRPVVLGDSGIDCMTGATVSSSAMAEIVDCARRALGRAVFDRADLDADRARVTTSFGVRAAYVALALLLAVALFLRGGPLLRDVFLVVNLVLAGLLFNLQFSLTHVFRVLGASLPSLHSLDWFLLVLGAVLLAVGFGPLYCGYLCPFGALQELLGRLGLVRGAGALADARARRVKYAVLAGALLGAAALHSEAFFSFDPLQAVFGFEYRREMGLLLALIALFSLFHFRFFCRYLCPTGAFFGLFNKLGLALPFARPKSYGRCDLGTKNRWEAGCLQCNRCLWQSGLRTAPERFTGRRDAVLAAGIAGALLLGILLVRGEPALPSGMAGPAAALGAPRDVDVDLIRRRIQERWLADHEALYYEPLGEVEEGRPVR